MTQDAQKFTEEDLKKARNTVLNEDGTLKNAFNFCGIKEFYPEMLEIIAQALRNERKGLKTNDDGCDLASALEIEKRFQAEIARLESEKKGLEEDLAGIRKRFDERLATPNEYHLAEATKPFRDKIKGLEGRVREFDTRLHFLNCENCEPVFCCGGRECGCYGMPVDFKSTDKCQQGCTLKFIKEKDDRLKALEAENEKLNRALRIESSEPEERSQEANHYNWLDDKNEELTAENARLKAEVERIKREYDLVHIGDQAMLKASHKKSWSLESKVYELEARLGEAVRVIEGYAECSDGCTCGDGWSHASAKSFLQSPTNSEARGGCEHDNGFTYQKGLSVFDKDDKGCPFCDKKTGGV